LKNDTIKKIMAKESIIVGIDIGTSNVRSIIAQQVRGEHLPRVVGVGTTPSFGIRRGSIIDIDEAVKGINTAIENAERMAGIPVKRAIINIGGCDIDFQNSKGVIAIGRADGEVTEDDINRVISEAQVIPLPMNKEIVHVLPKKYRLDDLDNIKDPMGMKGVRLEVDALIIESSSTQVKNLSKCVYQAGIEVDDIVLEPLAAAEAVLGKKQKELGVVLINIGGGTTSLAVYEEGELLHVAILPVGAIHITNDVAIGLRTSVEVAEKIKLEYGSALTHDINKKEGIELSQFDSSESDIVSRYHVCEIIEARLEEIFQLVNGELKKIGKAGLLPSGAVLVGGGAKMAHITELAKEILGLPVQVGFPQGFGGILDKVDDPTFATVAGLVMWNFDQSGEFMQGSSRMKMPNLFSNGTGQVAIKIKGWFKKFLP
jgi:cell division protein FtsA